jgi:hypothetical protein
MELVAHTGFITANRPMTPLSSREHGFGVRFLSPGILGALYRPFAAG